MTREQWDKFYKTPLAELERFGVEYGVIFVLEEQLGCLFVGDLRHMQDSEFLSVSNLARKSLVKVKEALQQLMDEIVNKPVE